MTPAKKTIWILISSALLFATEQQKPKAKERAPWTLSILTRAWSSEFGQNLGEVVSAEEREFVPVLKFGAIQERWMISGYYQPQIGYSGARVVGGVARATKNSREDWELRIHRLIFEKDLGEAGGFDGRMLVGYKRLVTFRDDPQSGLDKVFEMKLKGPMVGAGGTLWYGSWSLSLTAAHLFLNGTETQREIEGMPKPVVLPYGWKASGTFWDFSLSHSPYWAPHWSFTLGFADQQYLGNQDLVPIIAEIPDFGLLESEVTPPSFKASGVVFEVGYVFRF